MQPLNQLNNRRMHPEETNKPKSAEFRVEKGIKMPEKRTKNSIITKFPLKQMDVGDSFLTNSEYTKTTANSLATAIRKHTKGKKIKYTYLVAKDTETNFLRVWRKN